MEYQRRAESSDIALSSYSRVCLSFLLSRIRSHIPHPPRRTGGIHARLAYMYKMPVSSSTHMYCIGTLVCQNAVHVIPLIPSYIVITERPTLSLSPSAEPIYHACAQCSYHVYCISCFFCSSDLRSFRSVHFISQINTLLYQLRAFLHWAKRLTAPFLLLWLMTTTLSHHYRFSY